MKFTNFKNAKINLSNFKNLSVIPDILAKNEPIIIKIPDNIVDCFSDFNESNEENDIIKTININNDLEWSQLHKNQYIAFADIEQYTIVINKNDTYIKVRIYNKIIDRNIKIRNN